MCRKPPFDLGMFMGGVIVDDQMDIQISGNVGIDLFKKLKIFLMAMVIFAAREYFASG